MNNKKQLIEKIKEIKEREKIGLNNEKIFEQYKKNYETRSIMTKRDKTLFKELKENIEAGRILNNNRFRLSYLFDLNLDWDIAIILGKKNIGKTYAYTKLINDEIEKGREVIVVRTQNAEIDRALTEQFNYDDHSNVKVRRAGNGKWDLVKKWDADEKGKPIKVGLCCSVSTLTSYQGGSFPNVRWVIWDECISDGARVKLTYHDIKTFERFISSIKRDKKDFRVLIFGNLLSKAESSTLYGDPLLEYYGINPKADFKFIDNTSTEEYKGANILFYNSKDEFRGIEEQGVIGGIDIEANNSLAKNVMQTQGEKIVGNYTFLDSCPKYALALTYESKVYVITIATNEVSYRNESNEQIHEEWPVVRCSSFRPSLQPDCPMYTNEAGLYNAYKSCLKLVNDQTWIMKVRKVVNMFKNGRVLVANQETDEHLKLKIIKHFEGLLRNNPETKLKRLC